ncbi:GNAT family N-acetyltransferase [uncultured Microbacterium sp.]|uniref:GNAT family N-acetyltransferase n=1 Tax=uncultured Microbacterium sp. TaxID=191216 RepID=UPI0025CDF5BF|nr:GNAT family N-acetyltransferase [uncultured Microbacterium sp.]
MGEAIVLPADDPQREQLERASWHVSARSFGAQLDVDRIESEGLGRLVTRADGAIRELRADDVDAVLTLDAATSGDYPGGVATRHDPLTPHSAAPSESRRAFGAFLADGELVAMTFVDVHGATAETDFTVVHPEWRRRGVATAVKAASILALSSEGVTRFRTGGSADNEAILRANATLGYVRDEEWITLTRESA